MSFDKQRIELVKGEVHESDLRQSHKADITELLMKAGNATNGCENKTQAMTEAIAALAVCFARDAVYRRDDIRDLMKAELAAHANNCPLAERVPDLVVDTLKAEALKEDGTWAGEERRKGNQAVVSGHGVKAKADPWTARIIAVAAVVCFLCSAYMVKTIMGG